MLSQDLINLLLLLLAANVVAVIGPFIVRRIRRTREDRARARRSATAALAPGFEELVNAGRPWFFDAEPGGVPDERAGMVERDSDGTLGDEPADAALGLATDTAWSSWLEAESVRIARYRRPATIVLVELSGLDRLADRIGRAAAERLVPPVAETISRHARAADRIAQLDSTRFGILLVETDEISAINYVERIRSACDLWLAAGAVALRLSIGWAEISPERPAAVAYGDAEDRLFEERRRAWPQAAGEQPEVIFQATG
jgi:diguanylate cyclase (GGDEF)-like protein